MATQVKRKTPARRPEVGTRELWLASLGAVSLARKQAIATAGKVGERIASLQEQARFAIGEGERRAKALLGEVERQAKPLLQRIERQVQPWLAKAGFATKKAPARKSASRKVPARKTRSTARPRRKAA